MGCKILALTYKNANDLELNCSGTSLSIIQWLEALELEFLPMTQHPAWVVAEWGAFQLRLLFPSPKILKHYKALCFLPTLFSRRNWPEVQIRFLESPFCCISHLYLWDICPGHKMNIQDCFCTRKINKYLSAMSPSTFLVRTRDPYPTFLISSAFEKVVWKTSLCWFSAGSSEDYSRWSNTNFLQGEKPAWSQFVVTQACNRKIAHCILIFLLSWMLCVVLNRKVTNFAFHLSRYFLIRLNWIIGSLPLASLT